MKKLICIIFLATCQLHAAFDNTSYRYLMPGDFYNKLTTLFPNGHRIQVNVNDKGERDFYLSTYCLVGAFSPSNFFVVFGANSSITGEAQLSLPDSNTVHSLASCAKKLIHSEIEVIFREEKFQALSIEINQSSYKTLIADATSRIFPVYEKQLKEEASKYGRIPHYGTIDYDSVLAKEHTIHLVHYMLGPDEVIKEYGQANSAKEIANVFLSEAKRKKEAGKMMNLLDYTVWVLTNLVIREEFLAY